MLSLRIIVRANADRIGITVAALVLGAVAGIALLYLVLMFAPDRTADF